MMDSYTLPERTARITLGKLVFNEWSELGYRLNVLKLRGWKGKPSIRRQRTDRLWEHGVFTERGYSDARIITLEGRALLPTNEAVRNVTYDYGAILQDGGFERLTVDDPIMGTQWATVGLAVDSDISWHVPGVYPFQLQLIAPDPRKYGQAIYASSSVPEAGGGLQYDLYTPSGVLDYSLSGNPGTATLTNPGTAAASPIFTVTGSIPEGFSITEVRTGRRLVYASAIVPGSFVRVDTGSGSVTIDSDSDRSADLIERGWTRLDPLSTGTWLFEAPQSTGALMKVEVTPAWW